MSRLSLVEFVGMLGYTALYLFVFSGLGYMLAKLHKHSKQTITEKE